MPNLPAPRLISLLSALALLLLLLAPVITAAVPMTDPSAQHLHATDMPHDSDQQHQTAADCWQQCMASCASHCAPLVPGIALATAAGSVHGTLPPDLYQRLFPNSLHRPPIA
ncbi:hypothetical protein [Marinobacterium weihaiense]|uniref:Uncharacterized protein n=1 Tax=Marinobacterium weihaiense TaxID=2851016 RepID=A0ABS6M9Z9_9GAMM|nr:hypothetical protein [Marinobacterium weihaiense]MBV0933117.1 hypothetical protein [Marinobacterium weihaiense]